MLSVTEDLGRRLTASGRKKTEDVARSFGGMNIGIEKIATSPLPRARETAEVVAKVIGKQEKLEIWDELKPETETTALYRRLSKLKGESSILLVGHEPYLSELISELISGSKKSRILLKKSGMAKVAIDSFTPKASGQLRWLLTPRQLKKLA